MKRSNYLRAGQDRAWKHCAWKCCRWAGLTILYYCLFWCRISISCIFFQLPQYPIDKKALSNFGNAFCGFYLNFINILRFSSDLSLWKIPLDSFQNEKSGSELLHNFFEFYADFDYEGCIISPYAGVAMFKDPGGGIKIPIKEGKDR